MTKILMVDDDLDSLGAISRFLRLASYEVTLAEHSAAAAKRLQDQVFDLVITDLKMPGDSGLDLCRLVRKNYPKLPVVLISGMAQTRDVVEAMRDGALTFLEKPVDPDTLLEVIAGQGDWARPSLGPHIAGSPAGNAAALPDRVRAFEAYLIEDALTQAGGRVKVAMEILGVGRRTLNDKMSRLGINRHHLKDE